MFRRLPSAKMTVSLFLWTSVLWLVISPGLTDACGSGKTLAQQEKEKEAVAAMGPRAANACQAQPTATKAEQLYLCLRNGGNYYDIQKAVCGCLMVKPCSATTAWEATCGSNAKINSPTDGESFKKCLLDSIMKQTAGKDVTEVSNKANSIVKNCVNSYKKSNGAKPLKKVLNALSSVNAKQHG